MDKKYDSTTDTLHHIARVAQLVKTITNELTNRATNHDASKLSPPEKEVFDEVTGFSFVDVPSFRAVRKRNARVAGQGRGTA